MLSRLFDADRASLLTGLVLDAVEAFDIDLSRLHNDSTSLKLSGAYEQADGRERGGKPTPAVKHGFSKDHRPDLKQLVWILSVTADGAVPIAFRVADGNTADVTTHIATWDTLVELTAAATSSTSPTPSSRRSTTSPTSTPAPGGCSPCCPPHAPKMASSATGW
jgi:hypothetical protein